jgi:hypothetical protein
VAWNRDWLTLFISSSGIRQTTWFLKPTLKGAITEQIDASKKTRRVSVFAALGLPFTPIAMLTAIRSPFV